MTRYRKTVTPDGYVWTPDPDGSHIMIDRGDYIEMTPAVQSTQTKEENMKRHPGAYERMRELAKVHETPGYTDQEEVHLEADQILCDVLSAHGHGELVTIYNTIEKWYA